MFQKDSVTKKSYGRIYNFVNYSARNVNTLVSHFEKYTYKIVHTAMHVSNISNRTKTRGPRGVHKGDGFSVTKVPQSKLSDYGTL